MRDPAGGPFVSVIVPVFNDERRLRRCLEALELQTCPSASYEVVVVDNGSETPLTIAPGEFPHARFIREPEPGNSRARVTGLAHATGKMLAFTDADCVPDAEWLHQGISRFLDTPDCGLVGGRIEVVLVHPERPAVAELLSAAMHLNQKRFLEQGHWAAFANAFTSRQVIETIGTMNPTLLSGGEIEWGRRAHAAGFALAYAPEAIVRHPARTSVRGLCRRAMRFEVGWTQLRDQEGIGRGARHWVGQYLIRPVMETYVDVVRSRRLTWAAKAKVSALSGFLLGFRVVAYVLVKAGWHVDVRRRWG